MSESDTPHLIIYDDREWVAEGLNRYTGMRRYGSLHVRGRSARDHILAALPEWARHRMITIEPGANLDDPSTALPSMRKDSGVLIISARGAALNPEALRQVVLRMHFAKTPVVDRIRNPLFVYYPKAEMLSDRWSDFREGPLHRLHEINDGAAELAGEPVLMDIGELPNLLKFIAGSTATRSFNEIRFDELTYRKRSTNKPKMRAEHDFYGLIPASMKPWMAGAFDYREEGDFAEYSMLRYHFADSAFQWVHNAWTKKDFGEFLSRALFFLESRAVREASRKEIETAAEDLFLDKVEARWRQMQADPAGAALLNSIANMPGGERNIDAFSDYLNLARTKWKLLSRGKMVIGHGDPCLSNILYDPATSTMKLIDPKGATSESELWTHSLYDYCKLSHSILGDYDFINNAIFDVSLNENANYALTLRRSAPVTYKQEFEEKVSKLQNLQMVRLGEASLFLSMLPLHLDHPRKVVAFLLRARNILDGLDISGT